jgi:hypothetical protein
MPAKPLFIGSIPIAAFITPFNFNDLAADGWHYKVPPLSVVVRRVVTFSLLEPIMGRAALYRLVLLCIYSDVIGMKIGEKGKDLCPHG